VLRREFTGAALRVNLSSSISNSATTISLTDASTYPLGNSPFVIVIDRGTADEEKVLILNRSANTLTVSERGYDGTVALAHTSGAFVDHVLDAAVIQNMNITTYDNQVLMWMGA
jgi:hypothetical protein